MKPDDTSASAPPFALPDTGSWSEVERCAALTDYAILDTPVEAEFDDLVRLAADTFGAAIAVVNLVASDRQWFKAEVGIGARELPLDVSICAHAILQNDFLVIPDTREDARLAGNPLVTAEDGLRFYAGALLRSAGGLPIGTVCVLDRTPRPDGITPHQRLVLEVLARQVMTQLELRRALAEQERRADELADVVAQRGRAEDALSAVQERYRLAVHATNDVIWDWDFATSYVIWNEALEANFGYAPEAIEPTGEWWVARIHPDDRERIDTSIHAAIDGDADSWSDEYRFRRADGSYAAILDRGHVIRDAAGRATRMIGAMLDLSERQANRAALAMSEERLRLATDAAEVGFWDVDVVNDVLIWPVIVKRMFGIAADTPVSMHDFYAGLHPADREATGMAFAAACDPRARALYDVEYRTIGPADGVIRWVAAKGRGLFDEDGRCLRVIGTAIDITARKQAEDQLRELNETLEAQVAERTAELRFSRDIIEATTSPICAFDTDYRLIAFNRTQSDEFFRIFGRRIRLGDVLPDLLPPDQASIIRGFMARALHGESYTVVAEFGDPSLAKPFWELVFTPLRDESGAVVGAFHLANDISLRLRGQAELAAAQEALRQSQKMEAMGSLTGGVAHDFNNLLTPIIGGLDMLQRKGIGGAREQRLIAGALQSAERAKTLVQRLLAFARRQPLQPRAVDVGALVTGMADLVASTSGPQTRVVVDVAEGLPAAVADPNQLEMAILNLSVNARDAMPDGGQLSIAARVVDVGTGHRTRLQPGRYVRLSVADTGSGMDAETLQRAVEPFYSTKGIGKGTGLGLSMVHGLAGQLGGALTIESQPGRGTDVQLWLPATDELARSPERGDDSVATAGVGVALVVDDEALVRASTADMLADLGYDVVEAGSAEQALRLLDDGLVPGLMVTDHLMPGKTGAELAREVLRRLPDTRTLIVSGYAETDGITADLPRLVKPFRQADLAASIPE